MSFNPSDPGHYTECPLHEDFEYPEHEDDCDWFIEYPVGEQYCSCGLDDIDYAACYCADIKSSRDYDNACEKGGV